MPSGRRLAVLLVVLALAGIPPVLLRALCAGKTCGGSGSGAVGVPFCPLPASLKTLIAAGYRAGRSPDVLGVTNGVSLTGGTDAADAGVGWPSVGPTPDPRVPIAFFGAGIDERASVPPGTGLDQIAPTLADALGFRRSHPEVRAGTAVGGVADGPAPRLVVEIAWREVGTAELEASPGRWPFLRGLVRGGHAAATLQGTTGSLPLDPAATLTTIGTGGLPSQHGITGTLIRGNSGQVVRAWGSGAPTSVISTLPDDLDHAMHEAPKIGLVATDPSDRGIIGGTWYVPHDTDDAVVAPTDPLPAVRRLLSAGYGADAVPDVLAVVLRGTLRQMDARTEGVVRAVDATGRRAAFVVTATGGTRATGATGATGSATGAPAAPAASVAQRVDAAAGGATPIVAAAVPGGLFLDQRVLAASGQSSNAAVQAMLSMQRASADEKLFADAFPGFAVSFARYC